jgi:hypothetical protein
LAIGPHFVHDLVDGPVCSPCLLVQGRHRVVCCHSHYHTVGDKVLLLKCHRPTSTHRWNSVQPSSSNGSDRPRSSRPGACPSCLRVLSRLTPTSTPACMEIRTLSDQKTADMLWIAHRMLLGIRHVTPAVEVTCEQRTYFSADSRSTSSSRPSNTMQLV